MSSESISSNEQLVDLIRGTIKMEARTEHQTIKRYNLLYGFTTFMGVLLVGLVYVWCSHFRGGFAWSSEPNLQFNWHPVLMTLGLLFFYSQSMLIYRTNRSKPKKFLKLLHAAIHFGAFICSVIGLKAVFDFHNNSNPIKPNLYSLHSWIGLSCVIIFALQFFIGFVTFLLPYASKEIRQFTLPVHVAFGVATFMLCVTAAFMGLTEKALWAIGADYANFTSESLMVNFIGVILAVFAVCTLYLINQIDYKRQSLPEDEIVLSSNID